MRCRWRKRSTNAGAKVPMILDSLGELHMLRGDLDTAKDYLTQAVALATENGNKWYAAQALRTLGRCCLAIGDSANALAKAKEALVACGANRRPPGDLRIPADCGRSTPANESV